MTFINGADTKPKKVTDAELAQARNTCVTTTVACGTQLDEVIAKLKALQALGYNSRELAVAVTDIEAGSLWLARHLTMNESKKVEELTAKWEAETAEKIHRDNPPAAPE